MSSEFVEKDSKVGYIVTIVILSFIVIGLSGYIVYDKYFIQDECSVVDKEESEAPSDDDSIRELSVSEKDKLMNIVDIYNTYLYDYYLREPGKEIPNNVYLHFGYLQLRRENKIVTVDNMKDVLEKYFGVNNNIKIDDIVCLECNHNLYTYNEESNIYEEVRNHPGHGGGMTAGSDERYLSSEIVNEDEVSLVTHVIYRRPCGDTCGPVTAYYAYIDDSFDGKNAILGDPNGDEELKFTDTDYESIKDKLPRTIYKFKKDESGNFILKSVSIEK